MSHRNLPEVGRNLVNRGAAAGANSGGIYPDGIRCFVCEKVKPVDQYAGRQLVKWRSSIYQPYAPGGRTKTDPRTTCKSCTPTQTTELTCCVCHKIKGLNKFAKNQRKNPDRARCIKCVLLHVETDPDFSPLSSDAYSDTDQDDDDDDDFDAQPGSKSGKAVKKPGPAVENYKQLPAYNPHPNAQANPGPQTQPGFNGFAPPRNNTPNVARNAAQGSAQEWVTVSGAGSTVNNNKYGSPWGRVSTTATNSRAASENNAASRYAASAASGPPVEVKKNGWAKIDKVPKGKEVKWGEGNAAEVPAEDEWDKYGRDIQARKMINAPKTKKKVVDFDDDSDDDEDSE
ncbi:hypothetical protein RUND412_005325 [Rhizina undulata]